MLEIRRLSKSPICRPDYVGGEVGLRGFVWVGLGRGWFVWAWLGQGGVRDKAKYTGLGRGPYGGCHLSSCPPSGPQF